MEPATFSKHVAPGVYQIKETGGLVTTSVDRHLADGTMLSAPENGHLLATIDAIILAEYPAAPTIVGQQGASITLLVSSFATLVQWMKARGTHYFGHLTDVDLRRFIFDSSCGLDAVLKSQERLRSVIEEKRQQTPAWSPDFTAVLVAVGISPSQGTRLPAATALWQRFRETGKVPDVQHLPSRQVTTGVLWGRAKCFQLLWRYRKHVADGLSFAPSAGDIAKHVNSHGKPTGHTRELPVDYVCNLVGLAFTWLYEYGPQLAQVQRLLANMPTATGPRQVLLHKTLNEFNAIAASRDWPLRLQTTKDKPKESHVSWNVAVGTFLPTACFVICGIFTARRLAELVSIRTQSLMGTVETGYWYSSYVAKRAKDDAFPCTRSVADSIRALADLMKLRGIDERLPAFSAIRGTGRLGQRLRNALARFGKMVKVDPSDVHSEWRLAPHQFRKIFVLIYRWKYDHPVLIALSVYLGHVNQKHINVYTNSKAWKRDHYEAGKQFTLEKLRDIALGNVEPKGIFGKSLKRAVARALAQVELADESELMAVLRQLIEDRRLDLKATLWGYCGARSAHSNLRRAACATEEDVRSKTSIDPEKSSEEKCAGCLFFCTNSSRRAHWVTKSERLSKSVAAAREGSMVQNKMRERLVIIQRFTRNNFQEGDK